MDNTLGRIRDLLIIVAIYLFFMSWVYVHLYFSNFGLPINDLRFSYTDYLAYSYNVIQKPCFYYWIIGITAVLLLRWGILTMISDLKDKGHFFKKLHLHVYENYFSKKWAAMKEKNLILIAGFCMASLFPILYGISAKAASEDYKRVHSNPASSSCRINLFFKDPACVLSPSSHLDSLSADIDGFKSDITMLKNDGDAPYDLYLLSESDNYYFVLNQPDNTASQSYVYYIKKDDVLFAKIILNQTN